MRRCIFLRIVFAVVQGLSDSRQHGGPFYVKTKRLPLPPAKFIVRYAVLAAAGGTRKGWYDSLKLMMKSLCGVEMFLAPALRDHPHFRTSPLYVIYTDSVTARTVENLVAAAGFTEDLRKQGSDIRLLNLDDQDDPPGASKNKTDTSQWSGLLLDSKNGVSVRRALADAERLPVRAGRLLLGSDIWFLNTPLQFLTRAANLNYSQAVYMADRFTFENQLYTMTNYRGPQCPGLLGDFVYLGPGVHLDPAAISRKMVWYATQSPNAEPTDPPCYAECRLSNGLHAMDQFALNLALAESVVPTGRRGCFPLGHGYLQPWPHTYDLSPSAKPRIEAVHNKQPVGPCVMPPSIESLAAVEG